MGGRLERQSFDAARSAEAAGEKPFATFACEIVLNMNELRESDH
jgi:hypothetical protein